MIGLIEPGGWSDRRSAKQSCNLVRTIDVRRAPLGDSVAERIRRRNLMARVLGAHHQREPSYGEQSVAALLRGWRACGPCKNTRALDLPVATLLGEGDVAPQQDLLDAELEAQRTLLVHVSCKISVQHHASPGHGCAICCSISDVDLGIVRGRVRRTVTQYGADHVERRAALQHGSRSRMPEQIGSLRRGGDAATFDRTPNDARDGRAAQRPERSIRSEEQLRSGYAGPASLEIVEHGVTRILRAAEAWSLDGPCRER